MSRKPVFEGLIIDEYDHPVGVTYVGGEPCYVVDDNGFHRHIPSEQVDRQVLKKMSELIEGSEDIVAEQASKMLGPDDIFSRALIENQLKQIEKQFDLVMETGIPEEGRAYMGMMGFQVRINLHGEVLEVKQPGKTEPGEE
jgi:hypothetical protein